uniref:40S ribosomal protein S21-2-like n=1 Tax=Erigeron canadensis TaxID=72917 RepID=UPI001CB8FDA0|nr:40S ribosomal protein S21-2-like [Erigeron canadensis]
MLCDNFFNITYVSNTKSRVQKLSLEFDIIEYGLCSSATNRLITSKDHASVQINIGHLDESGRYTGQFSTFALCGFVRAQGDADSALDRLWQKKKVEARQ